MKKLFILLLSLISCAKTFSQSIDSISIRRNFILKTTPSYIFDFDNTFTLGVEKFYKKNKSMQAEFGYGNSNQNLLIGVLDGSFDKNNPYRNFNNYRIKLEHKRYFDKVNAYKLNGSYVAFELFSKIISKTEEQQVGRNMINGRPEYYERVPVNYRKLVLGSHLKVGHQLSFFEENTNKNSRLLLDLYAGFGVRRIQNDVFYTSKKENDSNLNRIETFGQILTGTGKNFIISATLGFKLGYVIPTKKSKS